MREINSLAEFEALINEMLQRCQNSTIAFERSFEVLGKSMASNFNAQGRPGWAARKGQYTQHPILDKTGRMRDAEESTHNGGNSIARITTGSSQSTGEFGTTVEYAGFHQYGTRKMVARPHLLLQPEDAAEIIEIHRQYYWWGN